MKNCTDYFVVGYNAILTFNVGDLPFITDNEAETKQYLYKKLNYMIGYFLYMLELHINRKGEEADDYYVKANKQIVKQLENVIKNHTVTKENNVYTLTLPFVGKEYEEDPKFSREENDGFILQFIFDMLRKIGMCYYMCLKVEVLDSISVIKELPKTPEDWEELDSKYEQERDYWSNKADNFRTVAIYEKND